MQKVVGSSPIIRSSSFLTKAPLRRGFFSLDEDGARFDEEQ